MALSASEQLCYCTTRIECTSATQRSTGTGFFFAFNGSDGRTVPILVTNRHVFEGYTNSTFLMTRADSDGTPINGQNMTMNIEGLQDLVRYHPDPNVDLCAIPIAVFINAAYENGKRLFYRTLTADQLPRQEQLNELTAIEDIIMIGYPNGLWDSVNNLPLVRKGITATHPNVDYEGRKEFVIDAACFNGSSGSPVLIFNPNGYLTKQGDFVIGEQRILFMGILYGGPLHRVRGLVLSNNTSTTATSVSSIPNNLGFVIKSERVLELQALFN